MHAVSIVSLRQRRAKYILQIQPSHAAIIVSRSSGLSRFSIPLWPDSFIGLLGGDRIPDIGQSTHGDRNRKTDTGRIQRGYAPALSVRQVRNSGRLAGRAPLKTTEDLSASSCTLAAMPNCREWSLPEEDECQHKSGTMGVSPRMRSANVIQREDAGYRPGGLWSRWKYRIAKSQNHCSRENSCSQMHSATSGPASTNRKPPRHRQ
jgi:hypothetical protein